MRKRGGGAVIGNNIRTITELYYDSVGFDGTGGRRSGIIFGNLPTISTTSQTTTNGSFTKHSSASFLFDQNYNISTFKPIIEIYYDDDTLSESIGDTLDAFTTFPTNSYIKIAYKLSEPALNKLCNGETIIRFSRLLCNNSNTLNSLKRFMTGSSLTAMLFNLDPILSTQFFYTYDISSSKVKQTLRSGLNTNSIYKVNGLTGTNSASSVNSVYVTSGDYGPCYMPVPTPFDPNYIVLTDGIYGDFIELEFKNPVKLVQFSFISDGFGRRYPRFTTIIGSNAIDDSTNSIVYDKANNTVFGPYDAGGTNLRNPSADNSTTGTSSIGCYSITPTTNTKYRFFRFIIMGSHSDALPNIRNISFKVDF